MGRRAIRTETELWEAVRAEVEGNRGWFATRLEDRTQRGLPDSFLGARGEPGIWVENKIGWTPRYRPGQLAWAMQADAAGQTCVTLVATMMPKPYVVVRTADMGLAALAGLDPDPPRCHATIADAVNAMVEIRAYSLQTPYPVPAALDAVRRKADI